METFSLLAATPAVSMTPLFAGMNMWMPDAMNVCRKSLPPWNVWTAMTEF
jgi:hypothetical protein